MAAVANVAAVPAMAGVVGMTGVVDVAEMHANLVGATCHWCDLQEAVLLTAVLNAL